MSACATIRRLIGYVRPHKATLILSLLCSVVSVAATLIVPILLGVGIDALFAFDYPKLALTIGFIAGVIGLGVFFQWFQGYVTVQLCYKTVQDMRESAYNKIGDLSIKALEGLSGGDTTSIIINDIDLIGDGFLQGIQQLITGVVTIVATLVIMLSLSVPVGLVVVLCTPASLLITWLIARATHNTFLSERNCQGNILSFVDETYQNQELITLFNKNQDYEDEFSKLNSELYGIGERAQFAGSLTNPGTRFVNNIVYALVALVACLSVAGGSLGMTIGTIQVFLSYTTQFSRPFYEITGVLTQVQTAFAGARRLFAFLDLTPMEPEPTSTLELKRVQRSVSFDAVDFSYEQGEPILKDVTWGAKAHDRIAVVGPTGCGKTTMLNLLTRYYDPDRGSVLIDEVDVSHTSKAAVRDVLGVVLQDTWIFEGSVRDNIAYGVLDASDDEIKKAAMSVRAADFIERLPNGYNTLIGGPQDPLSRGQRQLISIARVVLKKPSIMVLDEATSMIDTRTEVLVQQALDELMQSSTSIVVAHRLSTIRNATCILVMDKGEIVERGTHDELIQQGGLYAKLYNAQWTYLKADEDSLI